MQKNSSAYAKSATLAILMICLAIPAKAKQLDAQASEEQSKAFSGLADYYHSSLYGKKTASGQVLAREKYTAAHRHLPFGTRLKVANKKTGQSCIVTINDRGPFTANKVVDLSQAAAQELDIIKVGSAQVICTVLE